MDRFELFARKVRLARDVAILAILLFYLIIASLSAFQFFPMFSGSPRPNVEKNKIESARTKQNGAPEIAGANEVYEDLIRYISDDLKSTQAALRQQEKEISSLSRRVDQLEKKEAAE